MTIEQKQVSNTALMMNKVMRPMAIKPGCVNFQHVNGAMDLQLRNLSSQIINVWQKISRVIYLDPQCMERVLRQKYEK